MTKHAGHRCGYIFKCALCCFVFLGRLGSIQLAQISLPRFLVHHQVAETSTQRITLTMNILRHCICALPSALAWDFRL